VPRASLEHVVESLLGEERGGRFIDLRLDLVRDAGGELLYSAGGRWDRASKVYAGGASRGRRLGLHEGQVPAGRWFAEWMRARRRGAHVEENGKPVFSLVLVGGRRGGKSVLAFRALLAYLVDTPDAIGWVVVPVDDDKDEVVRELRKQLPRSWFGVRANEWTLRNGSQLFIRSSYDPQDLKRGRCDVALINEAQKHHGDVYGILRPAIADKGGLVILTANPPDTARGEWVADLVERAKGGKVGVKVLELDPMLNPHIDHAALISLKDELDDRTYRREILGEFLARTDVVMYAFSPSELHGNVRPVGRGEHGEELEDITHAFTRRMLGAPFGTVHGMDFQGRPYQAAVALRLFRDPADPSGAEPLIWAVDDVEVEQGSEDDLVSALEGRGYTGADAVIPDASGAWQDSERKKGHGSWDTLRARGWRNLFYPVANSKSNPQPKTERLAIANGLFRSASGKRRLFVAPHCQYLIRALRLWETRNGIPHWRSDYAHIIDALTYPLYRLFPRRAPDASPRAVLIERPTRVGGWDGLR
jgi:hypothetical protein